MKADHMRQTLTSDPTPSRQAGLAARALALTGLHMVLEKQSELPTQTADRSGRPSDASVGARIRVVRRAQGLTQQQLADACRVTRSAIAQWESGRAGQQAHHLLAVAAALSVPIETLREGGRLVNDPQIGEDECQMLALFRRCSADQRACLMTVARTLSDVPGTSSGISSD